MTADPRATRLRLVEREHLAAALTEALAGGSPVAVLPPPGPDRERARAALQPDQPVTEPGAAVVVLTSGSTGAPKAVVLTRHNLCAAVESTHRRLGGAGDWVLALPVHYVAGLMVVARGVVAGTRTRTVAADLSDLGGPHAEPARGSRPRYLALVATQLYRALQRPEQVAALRRYDAVLVGGGALPDRLLQQAEQAEVPVVTTYGMSETAGGCVYDGRPLDEVQVHIDTEERISITGPMVFAGYRLDRDLTDTYRAGATFRTSDRGRWVGDRLQVLGRCDQVVISGGLKVDLAAVEGLAAAWDRAADTVVLAVPDSEWGATVVAVTTSRQPLAELQRALVDGLPRHAVPRRIEQLTELPHTPAGKIDRPALQRLLQGAA